MRRIKKLGLTAILTAVACAVFFYLTEPRHVYFLYRCISGAKDILACWMAKPTAFKITTMGIAYEGNTLDEIDAHILYDGAYEKAEMFFLRDISRGGIFVDIGANKGFYSLFMSKYVREVHAFEPYEPVLKTFRALMANNSIKNIVIHPVGLGDKAQRLTFESPPRSNLMAGSFVFVSKTGPHEELEITTGDQALQDGVGEVDLMKMDIEGFEKPALRGLAKTLATYRPVMVFELTTSNKNQILFKNIDEIYKAFPLGYRFLVFKNADPFTGAYEIVPLDPNVINFAADFEQHDLIAVPVEKLDRIPQKGPIRTH